MSQPHTFGTLYFNYKKLPVWFPVKSREIGLYNIINSFICRSCPLLSDLEDYINRDIFIKETRLNSQTLSNCPAIWCRVTWLLWRMLLPSPSWTSDTHIISVMPVRNVELWFWGVSSEVLTSLGCEWPVSLQSVSLGRRTQQNFQLSLHLPDLSAPGLQAGKNCITLCFTIISDCNRPFYPK